MKRIVPLIAVLALMLAPSFADAQTVLTRSQVEAVSPQLVNLFNAMGSTFTVLQNQKNTQNVVLASDVVLLGNMSARLRTSAPTATEINQMYNELTQVQNHVSSIAMWRANIRIVSSNLINALSSLSGMLASAV